MFTTIVLSVITVNLFFCYSLVRYNGKDDADYEDED